MYRQEEPEVNLEQVLERLRSFFRRLRGGGGGSGKWVYFVFAIFFVALAGWLATGIYSVQPGEQAALRKFGKFVESTSPGLHWYWPSPIGTKAVVNVEGVRRLEVGLRGAVPVLAESLMITGDENIVDVQLVVQYDIQRSITDPDGRVVSAVEQFLFRSADAEGAVLKSATESALRQVVGQRPIDDVLTELKEEVQAEVKTLLQRELDLYQTGIRVREVKLQRTLAPSQVQDAFDDVVKAQEDRQRVIRLAEAYSADIVPRVKGEAVKITQAAEAFRAERVAKAEGEASRFLQVLQEFKESEDVTRQRLYLEAMEEILPNVRKVILPPGAAGSSVLFLELLKGALSQGAAGSTGSK